MQEQPTELDKFLKSLIPMVPSPIATPSKNEYVTEKTIRGKDKNSWPIQYILKTTKDIQITQSVTQRLNKLRNLPKHENLVPVVAKGFNHAANKAYVLSEYFWQSQSLEKIIARKRNLETGELCSIVYQVLRAMKFLQENKINHLRLNPSSILVKFSSNSQQYVNPAVRICDMGLAAENTTNYFHKFCLHPDFFDPSINLYSQPFEKCIKYDIWALGAIIYYCFKQIKPFHGKQSFFGDSMIFKIKHARDPRAWLAKSTDYHLSQSYRLELFIAKCWGLKQPFKTWAEALAYYEEFDYPAKEYEKISIFDIYSNHLGIIFLLCKVYMLLREQLQYQITKLIPEGPVQVRDKQRKRIEKLSLFVFKIAHLCHTKEFETHFKNRCSVLPLFKRQIFEDVTKYLQNQRIFLKKTFVEKHQHNFEYLLKNVGGAILDFKSRCKQKSLQYKTPKIQFLQSFFTTFLTSVQNAVRTLEDNNNDRCQVLNVFYSSNELQDKAKQCGFSIPYFSPIPEQ